jgi:hypothetical protein
MNDGVGKIDLAAEFGEAMRDLIFAPAGPLAELLRVQLADGRELAFGASDLATGSSVADGIVGAALVRKVGRAQREGRSEPDPLTLEELRAAALAHFAERSAAITRDNIRSILPERIPEDQAVVKVERVNKAR